MAQRLRFIHSSELACPGYKGYPLLIRGGDLLAEFNPSARIGFGIVGIQLRLEEIVGGPVDLLRSPVNKPRLKQAIDRQAILAF